MVSSLAPISCSTYNFFSYSYFTYNLKEETLDSFLKSRYKKRENIFFQTFICSRSFCRNQIIGSSLIGKCGISLVELEAFRVLTVPHPFTNLFFSPPLDPSFWSVFGLIILCMSRKAFLVVIDELSFVYCKLMTFIWYAIAPRNRLSIYSF